MLNKKIFYKFANKKKYEQIKKNIAINKKIKIFKTDFEKKILKIQEIIKNHKNISFLHSGHLGDVINALPVIKELSKSHDCKLYLQSNKPLEKHVLGYKHPKDNIYMSDKTHSSEYSSSSDSEASTSSDENESNSNNLPGSTGIIDL